jgi:predicted GNAT family N-acyltransferase
MAIHFLAMRDNTPIGTVRMIHPPFLDKFKLGRLAVRKPARGTGVAGLLVAQVELVAKELEAKRIYAGSQVPVRRFYEKCGYQSEGEEFLDEGQPHIMMVKDL